MRPSGDTAVASRIISPAPESASCPRWIMCQSVALPSSAEYWHIGAMTTRLGRSRSPMRSGVKSWLLMMGPGAPAVGDSVTIYIGHAPPDAKARRDGSS